MQSVRIYVGVSHMNEEYIERVEYRFPHLFTVFFATYFFDCVYQEREKKIFVNSLPLYIFSFSLHIMSHINMFRHGVPGINVRQIRTVHTF